MDRFPRSLLHPSARGAAIPSHEPPPPLYPEEEAAVRRAVPHRRDEFARGRGAARAALRALGIEPGPIAVGAHREPLWPPGVVGSISHCSGLAWAAVAPEAQLTALGIDVEPAVPLPAEVRARVMAPDEATLIEEAIGIDTVGFGAKECVHKAVHPRTGFWLDFDDVRLMPSSEPGALHARPTRGDIDPEVRALLDRLEGRWAIRGGLIFTAAWVAAP